MKTKKIIAFVVTVLLVASCLFSVGAVDFDVNTDNDFNIDDVTHLQKYIAKYSLDVINLDECDITKDGKIDIKDATYMQKVLAGILTAPTVTEEATTLPSTSEPESSKATETTWAAQTVPPTSEPFVPSEDITTEPTESTTMIEESSSVPETEPAEPTEPTSPVETVTDPTEEATLEPATEPTTLPTNPGIGKDTVDAGDIFGD